MNSCPMDRKKGTDVMFFVFVVWNDNKVAVCVKSLSCYLNARLQMTLPPRKLSRLKLS